jgi:dynein heavy chain
MRELSKVFQGVILAVRDRFKKGVESGFTGNIESAEGYLAALWRHECERVFCDKLTTLEDKEWGENAIMELVKSELGDEVKKQIDERIWFVDYLREPTIDDETGEVVDANPSFYESAPTLEALKTVVEGRQVAFNESSKALKLDLVLFTDAMMHLMRIGRLMCCDRGCALLVGVGGSGKQSLARLAASISGAYTFQIVITKTYNTTNLFEDIKGLYKIAGFKGQMWPSSSQMPR